MPSYQSTSLTEKFHHAKILARFFYHSCKFDAVWDNAAEKQTFESFVNQCVQEANVTADYLLIIHDDELRILFDRFGLSVIDRCVIRKYLNLPEDGLWLLWTSAKLAVLAAATTYRVGRWMFGAPGIILLATGVGFGFASKHLKGRVLEEVERIVKGDKRSQASVSNNLLAGGSRGGSPDVHPPPRRTYDFSSGGTIDDHATHYSYGSVKPAYNFTSASSSPSGAVPPAESEEFVAISTSRL